MSAQVVGLSGLNLSERTKYPTYKWVNFSSSSPSPDTKRRGGPEMRTRQRISSSLLGGFEERRERRPTVLHTYVGSSLSPPLPSPPILFPSPVNLLSGNLEGRGVKMKRKIKTKGNEKWRDYDRTAVHYYAERPRRQFRVAPPPPTVP